MGTLRGLNFPISFSNGFVQMGMLGWVNFIGGRFKRVKSYWWMVGKGITDWWMLGKAKFHWWILGKG